MSHELTVDQNLVLSAAGLVLAVHLMIGSELPIDSWQQHARSPAWATLVAAVILFVLLVRSVSPGCWLLLAGAAGNLVSWLQSGKVPDYMGFSIGDRWLAFNLADASIVIGALTVVATLTLRNGHGVRRRGATPR